MPLCIIAIVLGAMGCLWSVFGIVRLVVLPMRSLPAKDPWHEELHAEAGRRVLEATKETRPVSIVLKSVMFLASVLLAVSGIWGVRLKGLGRLQIAFALNLVVDTVAAINGVIVEMKTIAIGKWNLNQLAAQYKIPKEKEMDLQMGLYTGLILGLAWLLVKVVFYIVSLAYLRRTGVRQAFSDGAPRGF
jgi:hypothetical protein